MIELLQIIFKQNCENCNGSALPLWWELSKDILIPLGSAALAAYIAVRLFNKGIANEKTKETERKLQHCRDKLSFLSALTKGSIDTIVRQRKYIEDYISEIEADAIELKPITIIPWADLKRISDENLEDYLLAFADIYNNDRNEAVIRFKAIIGPIDFFYLLFDNIYQRVKKLSEINLQRKLQFQNLIDNCYVILQRFNLDLYKNDRLLHEKLHTSLKYFFDNSNSRNDFLFYVEFYFKPLRDLTIEVLKRPVITFQEIYDLNYYANRAILLYDELQNDSNVVKRGLQNDLQTMSENFDKLKLNSQQLLKDYSI